MLLQFTRRLEETSWTVETRDGKKKVVINEYPLESRYLPITALVFYTGIYVLIGCEIIPPMWVGVIHNSFVLLLLYFF